MSHSVIAAPEDPEFDEELGRYVEADSPERGIILEQEYPYRGPVLVDEAHNFRNMNQRSRGLRNYLESGDHKVVLMSATPQNLGPMDIYRQLTLFLDDTEHGLNLEPVSLEEYFHNPKGGNSTGPTSRTTRQNSTPGRGAAPRPLPRCHRINHQSPRRISSRRWRRCLFAAARIYGTCMVIRRW